MLFDKPNVIVALDFDNANTAINMAKQLSPHLCRLKVGKELFTRGGPQLVTQLIELGYDVFLDLKFHDIPNTVAKACSAAAQLGVWMLNVHASGGVAMMQAAQEAIANTAHPPLLIAVTVLTSMDETNLKELGISHSLQEHVLYLARLTQQAGLDGVVCSAQEAAMVKQDFGPDFCIVTPGIRLATSLVDDQKRIMTAKQAMIAGSNYLVIGRPITAAAEPVVALQDIVNSLN